MTPRFDQQSFAATRDDDRERSLTFFLAVELDRGLCRVELRAAPTSCVIATWTPTDNDARNLARQVLRRVDAEVARSPEVVSRIEADALHPRALLLVRRWSVPTHVVSFRDRGGPQQQYKLAHPVAAWGVA